LEVSEEGTEAAAASAVVMAKAMVMDNHFVLNRPFIFFIWDRNSQIILFSGLFLSPDQ